VHHLPGDEHWRFASRDRRSRYDDVGAGDFFADELTLAAQEVLGLFSRVPALALLGLEIKLDESGNPGF